MSDMVETFITFGSQYRHPGDHPQGMLADGYAVIEAPSRELGREMAFVVFGEQWAFDYGEQPRADWYPLGELMRVPWKGLPTK